jgi:hypothetical protein
VVLARFAQRGGDQWLASSVWCASFCSGLRLHVRAIAEPAGSSRQPQVKEGKQAVEMTRLSCHRFRPNEVRLWLSMIAYKLGNPWRRLVLMLRVGNWSLTSRQRRLVKTGGRLVKHARYYWLLLTENHLTRRLFASMVCRIETLPVPTG